MRRPRRGRKRKGGKHISVSATDAEWAAVRRNADRSAPSMARYLVGLVERDGEEAPGPAVALSPEEQREALEAVREIRRLMRGDAAPPESGGDGDGGAAANAPDAAGRAECPDAAEPETEDPPQGRLL